MLVVVILSVWCVWCCLCMLCRLVLVGVGVGLVVVVGSDWLLRFV